MTSQSDPDALPTPSEPPALKTTCHCGRVEVELPSKPERLNECHCTVCYKYGTLWGYFNRNDVTITTSDGATMEKYVRSDAGSDGDISFDRCSHCGCVMVWLRTGEHTGSKRMGVNCRMLPEAEIEGIERKVSFGPK